jgi:mRNA degradation ribonuclease J1/J2
MTALVLNSRNTVQRKYSINSYKSHHTEGVVILCVSHHGKKLAALSYITDKFMEEMRMLTLIKIFRFS